MSKIGLLEDKEGKFFAEIISDAIPVNGIWKTAIKLTLPIVINSLDNKVGDKLPEPWQGYTENMITVLYEALQDKVLTVEEEEIIVSACTEIINAEVDLPLLSEQDEAIAFSFLLKTIAALIRKAISTKN